MKYDAFISYRHTDLDIEMAKLVHTALEKYKVPASVQKTSGKKSIKRVFRDQEELPIGNNLSNNITMALEESEFLIVVCSTRTRESEWVTREIETFVEMHGRENILALLIDGSSHDSFPEALLYDVDGNPAEPLAADIRGADNRERKKKLRTEILRLAAPILHCTYDDLRQRHRERRVRTITNIACVIAGVVAIAGVSFAVYNARMVNEIQKNYDKALENQSKYLADTATELLEEGDREKAVAIAMDALGALNDSDEKPYVAQAEYALSQALYTYKAGNDISKDRFLSHDRPVSGMKYDSTHKYLITCDESFSIYIWDVSTGEKITQIIPRVSDQGYLVAPKAYTFLDGEIIVCDEKGLFGFTIEGEQVWNVPVEQVAFCEMYDNEGIIVCSCLENAYIYDIKSRELLQTLESPNNTLLFENKYVIDEKENAIFISMGDDNNTSSFIGEYSLSTGEFISQIKVAKNSISNLALTEAGNIVSLSYNYDEIIYSDTGDYEMTLECFSRESGELIWDWDHASNDMNTLTASSIVKCREYEGSSGERKEVVISNNSDVFVLDQRTGEELAHVISGGAIREMLLSGASGWGYLGVGDGTIQIVQLETGDMSRTQTIEAASGLNGMAIADSVIAIKMYKSSDVLLLKYNEGRNKKNFITTEERIHKVYENQTKTQMAVKTDTGVGLSDQYFFYDMDGNLINSITQDEITDRNVQFDGYAANGQFIVITYGNKAYTVNPETCEFRSLKYDGGNHNGFDQIQITDNGKYLAMFSRNCFVVVDTDKEETILDYVREEYDIVYGFISEDGKTAYIATSESGIKKIDIETAKETTIGEKELVFYGQMSGRKIISINNTGETLAVCCGDGNIRLLKEKNGEVIDTIPCRGMNDIFMHFSDDDSRLIYQGDDLYINIYDIVNKEKLYKSNEQYYGIVSANENHEGKLILTNESGMLVIETETYVPVAYADYGFAYNTEKNTVWGATSNEVFVFPYQTLDSMYEDAYIQFPDLQMTDDIRLIYNIQK